MAFNRIIRGWRVVGQAARARAEANPELFWNLTSDWWYRANVRIPETKERIRFAREMKEMFEREGEGLCISGNYIGTSNLKWTISGVAPIPASSYVMSSGTGVVWSPFSDMPPCPSYGAGYWDTIPRVWTGRKPPRVGRWLAKALFSLTWVRNPGA